MAELTVSTTIHLQEESSNNSILPCITNCDKIDKIQFPSPASYIKEKQKLQLHKNQPKQLTGYKFELENSQVDELEEFAQQFPSDRPCSTSNFKETVLRAFQMSVSSRLEMYQEITKNNKSKCKNQLIMKKPDDFFEEQEFIGCSASTFILKPQKKEQDEKSTAPSSSAQSRCISQLNNKPQNLTIPEHPGDTDQYVNSNSLTQNLSLYLDKTTEQIAKPKIYKTGYLFKKSPFFRWHQHFCIMKNNQFTYFKKDEPTFPRGYLDFSMMNYHYEPKFSNAKLIQFALTPVEYPKKSFIFKCDDEAELREWDYHIKEVLKKNVQNNKHAQKLILFEKFWQCQFLPHRTFQKIADNLDILLFKSKTLSSAIERKLTSSEYDHLGLLLKFDNDQLILFEATGSSGVGLVPWNTFWQNHWHQLYKKLVYRQLIWPRRRNSHIQKLESFVKQAIGKKYKYSALTLFKSKKNTQDDENISQQKTFFCSELVASALKYLNLLPKEIAASSYLPGAFAKSKNSQLQLMDGAYLTDEFVIDFEDSVEE